MPLFNTIAGLMFISFWKWLLRILCTFLALYLGNILMTLLNARFDMHHVLSIFWHPTTFLTPARASPAAKPLRNVIFGASFGRLWSIFKPPLLGKNSLGCRNSLWCRNSFGLSWCRYQAGCENILCQELWIGKRRRLLDLTACPLWEVALIATSWLFNQTLKAVVLCIVGREGENPWGGGL